MPTTIKVLLVLALLGGGVWLYQSGAASKGLDRVAPVLGSTNRFIELTDQQGRTLRCKITARHGRFIQIERESDHRVFALDVARLDGQGRRRLAGVTDFNTESLRPELLALAKREVQVELLNIPELCWYNCQYTGKRMQSSQGLAVDAYRSFLNQQGMRVREVALKTERSGDGGYLLPFGVPDVPCLRVGTKLFNKKNKTDIEAALVDLYVTGG